MPMPISLHSSTERPARADIDPLLTANYEELQPRLAEIDNPSLDIPIWIAAFWSHADKYLPPDGRTWIVRDEAGRAVGWGTLRRRGSTTRAALHGVWCWRGSTTH